MSQLLLTKKERLFKVAGIIAPALMAGGALLGLRSLGGMAFPPKDKDVPRFDTEYPLKGDAITRGDYFRQGDTVYHNSDKWNPMRSMLSTFEPEELESLKELGYLKYNHVYDNDLAKNVSGDLFRNMNANSFIDAAKNTPR